MKAGWRLCLLALLSINGILLTPHAIAAPSEKLLLTEQEQQWIKQHPVVYFAADTNLAPFEYIQDGQYRGLFSAYLQAITDQTGLKFALVPTDNWAQAQQAFIDGKVDLLPNVSPERVPLALLQQLSLSPIYYSSPSIILTRADAPIITHSSALRGKRVAIRGGGSYERKFAEQLPNVPILRTSSPDEAFRAVANGQAYATVGTEAVMTPLLRRRYFGILGVSGTLPEISYTAQVGVRNTEPELISIINKALSRLSAKQTDDMYERWLRQADYGAPTLASLIHYRAVPLSIITGLILLLLAALWRMRQLKQQAVSSEREKSRFLAVMSHEIRTPMNAIVGSVELLQRTPMSARQSTLVRTTANASDSLLTLLDDVLDLSKLDAHRLRLERQPTLPLQLTHQSVDVASVKANAKQLPIHVHMAGPEDQHVSVDPTRLRQILTNLIGNAVKFTERGCINVDVHLHVKEDQPEAATLSVKVSDTGIGIKPADKQKLFKPYSQADDTMTRRFGGTGLGLTICKELVELMAGEIRLDSLPGVGTSVSFTIPSPLVAAPVVTESEASQQSLMNAHPILIIEDHPENQRLIREQLQLLGLKSEMAATGARALDLITQKTYALALMDCHMPGMSGYEAAAKIRQLEHQLDIPRLPVIAISAATDPQHLQYCMDSGMDGVLSKPLRLSELQGMLHLWLGVATPLPNEQLPIAEPTQSYHEVLLEDIEHLKASVVSAQWNEAFQLAHRIRGAALMFEDDVTAAVATHLEALTRNGQPPHAEIAAGLEKLSAHALMKAKDAAQAAGRGDRIGSN